MTYLKMSIRKMNQFITEFVAALILFQVLLAIWNKVEKEVSDICLAMFPQNYLIVPLSISYHLKNDSAVSLAFVSS